MATLMQNIEQSIQDFNNIKQALVDNGIDVPNGTKTSEYGELINNIRKANDRFYLYNNGVFANDYSLYSKYHNSTSSKVEVCNNCIYINYYYSKFIGFEQKISKNNYSKIKVFLNAYPNASSSTAQIAISTSISTISEFVTKNGTNYSYFVDITKAIKRHQVTTGNSSKAYLVELEIDLTDIEEDFFLGFDTWDMNMAIYSIYME